MTPSPAPDRLTALIDRVDANVKRHDLFGSIELVAQIRVELAALRAEAASLQKWRDDDLIARVAVEFTQDVISKGRPCQLPFAESEVEAICRGAIGEARRRMVQRRLDAARATTPEVPHAE